MSLDRTKPCPKCGRLMIQVSGGKFTFGTSTWFWWCGCGHREETEATDKLKLENQQRWEQANILTHSPQP
ncbi:MAG: hypothetical protein IAF94_08620 [Pirellulaceae bacterium]|nr:hypothetical protein [Pirellulaceae bacterium]